MTAVGAVACGHPATAAAAQEILEDGGNAFDAALAALCAATVAEPVLCSLGGGGFLLARRADGSATLYDFFVETPLRRRPTAELDFYPILADFGTATQEFHIGLGACATPGLIKGLFAAQAELCRLPMTRLVAPAVRMAREGLILRPVDGYLFQVVSPILVARPEGRARFATEAGTPLGSGAVLRQPELAATLEALAREGADLFYAGELGRRLVSDCATEGGQITAQDLAHYRVVRRAPLMRDYRGTRILTNPPPSSGGILIAFALALLVGEDVAAGGFATPATLRRLAQVMALTNRARIETRLHEALETAGADDADACAATARLLDPALLARYAAEVRGHPATARGTTHISVIDGAGNVASLSTSNGEGCGYLLPDSGIMLNNMLGEEDLNPGGFHTWPEACRISSMMAPTVAERPDGSLVALGSGGSNRIRTAILQVLLNLIDFALPVAEAVNAPRLHFERGIANLEGGLADETAAALAESAEQVIAWPPHNLFFGGVHGVTRSATGVFDAAGDPRRGGATLIV